ncbi:MAG: hypothetical protein IJK52_05585 [Oscillospiraceae bacterium]|nr:hypothetical protein [Oscillospiraceae bacterium]
MDQSVILGVEHKPEVDALLSGLKGFDSEQKSYILGVIDGTAAQIARQNSQAVHPATAT